MSTINTKPTKVIRFCSRAEAEAFMIGQTIYNDTNHSLKGKSTTSIGCCFAEGSPREAWRRLKGLEIYEVCLELVFKPAKLLKSKGRYVDYSTGDIWKGAWVREWCCTQYSLEDTISARIIPMDFASKEEIELSNSVFRLMKRNGL